MKRLIFIFLLSFLLLQGCREDFHFTDTVEIENYSWNVDNVLKFDFSIEDTSEVYMFFIDVRHTADFEYSNFYVFPKRVSPNGKMYTDTLNIPLADPSGIWFGKGAGDILDNRVLWMKDVKFPQTGKYTFSFEQGSREPTLDEVVSFGFSIYKYKQP